MKKNDVIKILDMMGEDLSRQDQLIELLTRLRHYVDREEIDIYEAMTRSYYQYLEERKSNRLRTQYGGKGGDAR